MTTATDIDAPPKPLTTAEHPPWASNWQTLQTAYTVYPEETPTFDA